MKDLKPTDIEVANKYVETGNGVKSVLEIYPDKTYDAANKYYERLSGNVVFQQAIEKAKKAAMEKLEITTYSIAKDFKEIKERCMQQVPVMVVNKETKVFEQAVDEEGEGVWTFDANAALKALENLGKHLDFYHNSKSGTQVNIQNNINNQPNYDLTLLSQSERKDLKALLLKATPIAI